VRGASAGCEGAGTQTYVTGDRFLLFHFCATCACHTHWTANPEALAGDLPDAPSQSATPSQPQQS
jgi:hypothetical protein